MPLKTAAVLLLLALSPALLPGQRSIAVEEWGAAPSGERVQLYTLANSRGVVLRVTTYGGILVSLEVPDKAGRRGDVLLGFDSLEGYLGVHPYFGALIGRYGNRIAKGVFPLDDRLYTLAVNNGANALHGGIQGFDKRVWAAVPFEAADGVGLKLRYISADGEEGYPGTLAVEVRYTLTDDNALRLEYQATTDAPTVLNLTNHAYFNLKDAGRSPVLDHEVQIEADHYTPVDETLIPLGRPEPVEGTPFDFREPHKLGERIDADDEQIRFGGGYDHNYVLRRRNADDLEHAVTVYEPTSGRVMEVWTTQPGVQVYTGNFLDGSVKGKSGVAYQRRAALCLETQHYPDSPNQEAFPSAALYPGELYKSTTEYRFSTR
ncbi:MAG: galactose-1-epimerase [Acidobacteria bacterium]|nr:galactose-1-epimerase [Acidobacteriota bacterium]